MDSWWLSRYFQGLKPLDCAAFMSRLKPLYNADLSGLGIGASRPAVSVRAQP